MILILWPRKNFDQMMLQIKYERFFFVCVLKVFIFVALGVGVSVCASEGQMREDACRDQKKVLTLLDLEL